MEKNGLYSKLTEYSRQDVLPMHMPGHKRKSVLGVNPYAIDITEISGFDNLHDANDIIKYEQERLAKIYGAGDAYILVNGSTCGNLAAFYATVSREDTVLVDRGSHKSIYNAIELVGCECFYSNGYEVDDGGTVYALIDESRYELREFITKMHIGVIVITCPAYTGETVDIGAIAAAVHAAGGILIVDSAHGAHLGFSERFPGSAISQGADAAVISLHKTLPALTQTAALLVSGDRIDREKIKHALDIFETSSPSYVLMASVSQCLDFLEDARKQFDEYADRIDGFYEKLANLEALCVVDRRCENKECADPSKIVLKSKGKIVNGLTLFSHLRDDYHIECEMYGADYVLLMSTVMDDVADLDRLAEAIAFLDKRVTMGDIRQTDVHINSHQKLRELRAGQVADFTVTVYPPSVPIVMKGDIISDEHINKISEAIEQGLNLIY